VSPAATANLHTWDPGQWQREESRYPCEFQPGLTVCLLTKTKRSTCRRGPRSCSRSHFSLLIPLPTPMDTLLSVADSRRRRRMPSTNRDLLTSLAAIQRLESPHGLFRILISMTGQSIRCIGHRRGHPEGALGREGEL